MTDNPLKITVLGTRGFPQVQGGVEVHCQNLYPHLVEKGCEVIVFTRKPYVNPSLDNYKGVKLVPLSCPKSKFLEAYMHTLKGVFEAKKLKPDILHIHAIGPALCVPLARMLGLKVVLTHHGPDYKRKKWGMLAKAVLRIGESWGCRKANAVISVSKTIAGHVREKYKREVTVIPNGVVLPEILQSDEALRRFGLKKGKYVLAVGRFVPEKGFDIGLRSWVLGRREGWKFAIIGDADHEDKYSLELKRKAKENPDVVLTGFLTGKPLQELYSHAGLFVLPSYYEGLPIVLLEAMSYGLSCIVSDIPANREVGLDEERYFRTGDIKALTNKITEFINKPLSTEEKEKQRKFIAERYDWERIAEKTLEVYRLSF